eukprot:TRINITY_DN2329_c0_g1_i1.p1 TRINITY_DN2329_c0_g1~~TRINITY_DN2329_c0_g1_i1.p1  ORF type:complete len:396 (+),score=71.39 TRINITY_DN2329_c0_g1_i1:138-1190(+)
MDGWQERLEKLIDDGELESATAFMEQVISTLENLPNSHSDLRLAAALNETGRLYSTRGFSMKADSVFEKSLVIKNRAYQLCSAPSSREEKPATPIEENKPVAEPNLTADPTTSQDEEDWEAMADQIPDLSSDTKVTSDLAELSLTGVSHKPKQRGRGAFTYGNNSLYSDQKDGSASNTKINDECLLEDCVEQPMHEKMKYGTSHILVVEDFSPNTSTADIEKLFESFRSDGVTVRWIHDTLALAVFSKPFLAHEAMVMSQSGYKIRKLAPNDPILIMLSNKDLEPPLHRPRTSAQTANRLILGALRSQGIAPNSSNTRPVFNDIKEQEKERRNRILTRQRLREEAWGSDD